MQSVGGYGVLAVACASSWLSIGGYSIPAIPTRSTANLGRVGRARMPYPPKFPLLKPILHARGEEGFKVGYRFRNL